MVLARYSSGALTSRQAVTGAAVALGAVSATAAAVYVYRYGLPSTSGSWASVRRYLTRYGVIAARPGAVPPAALGARALCAKYNDY